MIESSEQPAAWFKALSEPVRLRILYLLLESDELCVCELVEALALEQSLVSRHLAYLRRAGLISGRRQGTWVYYRLTRTLPHALLRGVAELLDSAADCQQDRRRRRTLASSCETNNQASTR